MLREGWSWEREYRRLKRAERDALAVWWPAHYEASDMASIDPGSALATDALERSKQLHEELVKIRIERQRWERP